MLFRETMLIRIALATVALTAVACTSHDASTGGSGPATSADASATASDAQPDTDPPADLVLADVEVTVAYTGADNSPLVVGAFASNPPSGAPVAHVRIDKPTFPRKVKLRDVEKGTWYIIALLDHDPPSPTIPGDEDPTVTAPALTVVDDTMQHVTISLPVK